MEIRRLFCAAASIVLGMLGACSSLPPTPPLTRLRQLLIAYPHLRVGVLNFGGAHGANADYARTIPAALLMELKELDRFIVYEAGGIRIDNSASMNEDKAKEIVDMYVSGTISSVSSGQVCAEFRMANAVSHEVLYVGSHCIPNGEGERHNKLKIVAKEIAASVAIDKIGGAMAEKVDDTLIYLDKGENDGVRRGMIADLIAKGEYVYSQREEVLKQVTEVTGVTKDITLIASECRTAKSESAGRSKRSTVENNTSGNCGTRQPINMPHIVGALYILSVQPQTSIGILYKGDYALRGDSVRFR